MQLSFTRVAIVNRGEPAMRLLHAVRELNEQHGSRLRTISLYTEPDRHSMFVREADDAVCIGPASFVDPSDAQRKSKYLDYAALRRALVETRAEAAWVGWGFVAEHAQFADLCRELGIVFIGPSGDAMRRVGDKIASKLLAESASVPVAPWTGGAVESVEDAIAWADKIGFPLMIKATAGGGGRGVRRILAREDLDAAFRSAQSEALKFFGSATVFLEKAIVGARHVEVQVLADHHGNCWAVGVRDCTIQRRNQKVLEEAPSPVLDEALDQAFKAAAVRLTRAAGYTNAGTVEFLFDVGSRSFYFMEMNTRLQVEHPVTEATTGLDLVKMQLAIASGNRLEGPAPATVGHAIEVRINAEDPDRQFAPAPGRVELLRLPTGPGLRVDTGVSQGDQVAPDFDSMIAKLIAYGNTREEAASRLRRALIESAIVIRGGTSNKAFLLELLSHPDVVSNRTDIGWLDRIWSQEKPRIRPHAAIALLQAALDVYDREFALERRNFFVSASRGRMCVRTEVGRSVELRYAGQNYRLEARRLGADDYRVYVDGQRLDVSVQRQGEFERWLTVAGTRYRVVSVVDGLTHLIEVNGVPHSVSRDDGGVVHAPSPAVTLAIQVKPGDVVAQGAPLLVLEAMKMEMSITAPCAGRVRKVMVGRNVQVAAGAPLVLIEPEAEGQQSQATERVDFALPQSSRCACGAAAYHQHLCDVRRLMLGYEIDARESKALCNSWPTVRAALPVHDDAGCSCEDEALGIFADLLAVYRDEPAEAFEQHLSAEENLTSYLRSVNLAGKGLPAAFIETLKRALRHYGVTSLDPTPELDDALVFASKAVRRMDDCAAHAFAMLEFRLQNADALTARATPEFRELLDRVISATQDRYVPLNDLAREARFRFFDRLMFADAQEQAYRQVHATLHSLGDMPNGGRRAALMASLVDCPYSLQGLLSSTFVDERPALRRIGLEVMLRRFFRICALQSLTEVTSHGRIVLRASYREADRMRHVVATYADYPHLEAAIEAALPSLSDCPDPSRVHLDLYAVYDGSTIEVEQTQAVIAEVLERTLRGHSPGCVCVSLGGQGTDKPVRSFTFTPSADGGFREHEIHPGMHPMLAERLEIWRLKNFRTEQLAAREHTYLFYAVARDNPKDERLFAFVDVPDLTPRRDQAGHLIELPHLEYLYLEAVAGIREIQARRSARDRLQWNRIVLLLRPLVELGPSDILRVARRLAPAAKNLGLEKSVVRLTVRDEKTGELVDRVLHISNRAGTGLRLQFDTISDLPVRSLSAYSQRVVRMRRLGLLYPYEVIRMLTPSRGVEQAEFPAGDFTEYDLDDHQRLVPVDREPGSNRANVVVGVIRNMTAKHPEGMARVMLLGDASREMGALAEPECRRIIAALDLAESLRVPLDWFPVSSGAKIAMDVGTEGLDWVARVLRRLIEYTQAGGVVNVVVTGVNVGGQSYWNAEATMLMHTKGILVMTPQASMVLTGKRALDYSGGVSAETNQGIGGFERIMGPNGQAQYFARDVAEACQILFRHYEHTYVAPGEHFPRRATTSDPAQRDVCAESHASVNGTGFDHVGDVFSAAKNPGRKKPFDVRSVMRAVVDKDHEPLERWLNMRDAETAVTWDVHLGGIPVSLIGIESRPLQRVGPVPGDGPETWTGGTLFPESSKKVARAINGASGNRPVVVLANLSGFDGSPESMRERQLEFGAEIGRAVVNFRGPMVFCVISRYHGGAYVVFSCTLNEHLQVAAIDGSHASVIGGAPAAAVVFPAEVKARTLADPRVKQLQAELGRASDRDKPRLSARYDEMFKTVFAEKQGEVAEYFDSIHSVQRARDVGSLHEIIPPSELRPYLITAVERGMRRWLDKPSRVPSRTALRAEA
ncbi:MAG: ATP-grasp domain-containing protein [Polyangiaceae bacterium]|nr:ATP-grasp domain-containing protein [Polyangiaceae bacterium]